MEKEIEAIWVDLNEELYHFIVSKVNDAEVAKDILQDTFYKVQRSLHQLKQPSKLTSWVYQITRNTILDHYRKDLKKLVLEQEPDLAEDDGQDFEYAKLSNCINGKIQNLSTVYKEAIVLTYLKDYSQKQLAEHTKLSYSGAKSRVQKARDILKENMLDCPNVESDTSGKILDFKKKLE